MTEPEKSEAPPPAAAAADPGPAAAPAEPSTPAAPPPAPARTGKPKHSDRGGGGMPGRRMREAIPSLEDDTRFNSSPRLKDLDAEIAGELEAALGGIGADLYAADESRQARQKSSGTPGVKGRQEGTVLSVHGKDVFIDVPGGRSQGVLPLLQFPDGPPQPGTKVEVSIEGYDRANGLLILSRKGSAVHADWSTIAEGMIVEARVLETNKGGLTVDVNGIRGFMPISQIDLYRVEDALQFVNQKLLCMITDVEPSEHNLVVSRRALLEKQREEMREKLWQELAEGQVHTGIVRSIREFGAFVDIGGVDGLLPISEMSWRRIKDPSEVVQLGQSIQVTVLRIDLEKRKISLSLKQLQASPWDDIQSRFPTGHVVQGTVTRLADFGAFVELEPGVEGLIHISELARNKVWRVRDVVVESQVVQVKVLNVDPEQRRISLSLRQAIPIEVPKTDEEEDAVDAPDEPIKPRPSNPNLRGGIGAQRFELPTPEE